MRAGNANYLSQDHLKHVLDQQKRQVYSKSTVSENNYSYNDKHSQASNLKRQLRIIDNVTSEKTV